MKKHFFLVALALGLGFTSCSEDEKGPSLSEGTVTNTELKAALVEKGLTFDATGHLEMNEAAMGLTALDLSGKKIADYTELAVLPNLNELKLQNNGFGPVFDLAVIPAQITKIDLTNNDIYDFEGLVKVVIPEDGGDPVITNLREIEKLYIPNTMKANFDDMVYFYIQNKKAIEDKTMDVQMADEKGKLNVYSTLRNVPDAELVKYFKHEFPEVMVGEQIDMAANLSLEYNRKGISISAVGTGDVYEVDVLDFEGVQYLANNPNWKGTLVSLTGLTEDDGMTPKSVMPTFPIGPSVTKVFFTTVSGEIDFSKAANLTQMQMMCNNGITEMDLTGATLWGTRDDKTELSNTYGSAIMLAMCSELEKIIMPKAKDQKIFCYSIEMCPKLKELDMSNFKKIGFGGLVLAEFADNCKLTYPTLDLYQVDGVVETSFACSTNVWNVQATKDFLDKHYTKIKDTSKRIMKGYTNMAGDDFDWESELLK